jgi:TetR/AcrR family transcriptional repressor of nem operon
MNAHPAPATRRDPDATRQALLGAAFEEIQAVGFRAASLDNILARVGVTKGALYHHFPNKNALGLAVIDELIWPQSRRHFEVLADARLHPVDALISVLKDEMADMGKHEHMHGCPVCNLVQDMAGVDEEFRLRLLRIQEAWQEAITAALVRGQQAGQIRREVDARAMAALMVAAYEGANVMAKAAADNTPFERAMQGLIAMGESLRLR